jgi:integrase/recombinase XerD
MRDVFQLADYCKTVAVLTVEEMSLIVIKKYLVFLKRHQYKNVSFARKIASIRSFCYFCTERYNAPCIASQLITPKIERTLPKALTHKSLISLLRCADKLSGPTALRDRAIVYLLYATGIRVSELIGLTVDAFEHRGFVRVFGKGSKERLVPLTSTVQELMNEYLLVQRTQLLAGGSSTAVFFARWGGRIKSLTRQAVWKIIRSIGSSLRANGLRVSPHVLRHSLATHMLQNGMDLRSLQVLLGHEQLSTVQIYTKIETSFLRKTYDKKHNRS